MSIKNKKTTVILTIVGLALSAGFIIGIGGWFGGGASISADTMTRGLVGYWSMDEGFGNRAYDASNYQNHGTTTGATWTQGKVGGALSFDGVDDYVEIGNPVSLQLTSSFTIEMWTNTKSFTSTGNYIKKDLGIAGNRGWYLNHFSPNGTARLLVSSDGTAVIYFTTTQKIPTGRFVHLVGVYDASALTLTIYFDGVSQAGTLTGVIPSSIYDSTATVRISRFIDGLIDEVRIYNRALTAEEIRYHYNRGGPVGQWKFDEGSGQTAFDSSGNSNNGILGATTATSTDDPTWTTGKYGSALNFDGVDDYVNMGDVNNMGTSDFSLEAWVKITLGSDAATSWYEPVIAKWDFGVNRPGYQLGMAGSKDTTNVGKAIFSLGRTGYVNGYDLKGTSLINDGQWHHLVGVVDKDSYVKIYVDGVQQNSVSISDPTYNEDNSKSLKIGGSSDGWGFPNGLIDEVRIYNYARTPDEIALDYNAGFAAKAGGTYDFNQGQVGYWGMDEGAGQYANDGSGNNNNGRLGIGATPDVSDPTWTIGKVGGALSFDGVDDYVNAGNGTSIQLNESGWTVEAWIYPLSAQNTETGHRSAIYYAGSGATWWIIVYDNDIMFQQMVSPYANISANINNIQNNIWYHVVVASSGTTKNIYVNGILIKTGTLSVNNATQAIISRSTDTFNGLIDEVRIYNRALSVEEIRYHYNRGAPVAQWKFDEGSGSTAYDSTENNNDATIYDATWTTGKYGSALSFDGVNDYVNIGNPASLQLTSSFTAEGWMYIRDNYPNSLVAKDNIVAGDRGWYFKTPNIGDTSLRFLVSSDGTTIQYLNTTNSLNLYQWYHLVAVYNASAQTLKIYVNGVEWTGSLTGTVPASIYNTSQNVNIAQSNGGYTNGLIDDVRIYNYARTPDEIKLDYNAGYGIYFGLAGSTCDDDPGGCITNGLVDYWAMEEGSGQYAYDGSGNNNNGRLGTGVNPDVSDPTRTTGKVGGALSFDGVNDYVTASDSSSLTLGGEITVEAWVYPKSFLTHISNQHRIFNKMVFPNAGWYFYALNSGQLLFNTYDGTIHAAQGPSNLSTGQWYHIVGVSDGTNNRVYINGVSGTPVSSGTLTNSTFYLSINGFGTQDYSFDGLIDEVRIYNRALSAEEIRYHYNRGAPVAQWKLEEGEGQTVFDSTENNNDGTLGATTATSTDDPVWIQGKYGSALSFDGVNDYVRVVNSASLQLSVFTVEAWVKPGIQSFSYADVVSKRTPNDWTLEQFTVASKKFQWIVLSTTAYFSVLALNQYTEGIWYHLVGTFNGTTLNFFINGVSQGTAQFTGTRPALTADVFIGSQLGTDQYFNGLIDDVRIYNYARTPVQILQDYNAGYSVYFK